MAYWNSLQDDRKLNTSKVINTSDYVTGNRTRRFRDSLLPDQKYITSFVIAGWTNDVMASVHTIQLALLTHRIPILPPFAPSHTGPKSGLLGFSEVFDVPRLSQALNLPILDWHDVKETTNPTPNPINVELYGDRWNDYYGGETEEIGCWSLWMTQMGKGAPAREGRIPEAFGLDVSWTPVPWGYQIPTPQSLDYNTFETAALATSHGRERGIEESKKYLDLLEVQMMNVTEDEMEGDPPSEIPTRNKAGHQMYPEEQMVCYDYLYFMATYSESEWWQVWTPAWEMVGKEVHWTPRIRSMAVTLLNEALNTSVPTTISSSTSDGSTPTPPTYIAVHIRRADFDGWCGDITRADCLAPISAYARRVKEVEDDLRAMHGHRRLPAKIPVLVMSDEPKTSPEHREAGTSEAWWASVAELGWIHVDHDLHKTEEKYGVWYPAVLDATMLSLASGFVGTGRSTYSLLAKKRVETWQGGPTRFVQWGFVGADAH